MKFKIIIIIIRESNFLLSHVHFWIHTFIFGFYSFIIKVLVFNLYIYIYIYIYI